MAMFKTTVYLSPDLKSALEVVARSIGRSEADLIREGIGMVVAAHGNGMPTLPLFDSGDPTLADRVDEELAGFGER